MMLLIRVRRLPRFVTLLGLLLAVSSGCDGPQQDLGNAVVVPEPGTSSSIVEGSGDSGLNAME